MNWPSRKEIRKLTFRALPLRWRESEGLTLETSASESLYGGQFTLSTQLIKANYLESERSWRQHDAKLWYSVIALKIDPLTDARKCKYKKAFLSHEIWTSERFKSYNKWQQNNWIKIRKRSFLKCNWLFILTHTLSDTGLKAVYFIQANVLHKTSPSQSNGWCCPKS